MLISLICRAKMLASELLALWKVSFMVIRASRRSVLAFSVSCIEEWWPTSNLNTFEELSKYQDLVSLLAEVSHDGGKMKREKRDLRRLPTSCLMKPPTIFLVETYRFWKPVSFNVKCACLVRLKANNYRAHNRLCLPQVSKFLNLIEP